eukprot:5216992-Amphidinium_carterae.2
MPHTSQRPQCCIPAVTTAGRQLKQMSASSCRAVSGGPYRCLRRASSRKATVLDDAAAPADPILGILQGNMDLGWGPASATRF